MSERHWSELSLPILKVITDSPNNAITEKKIGNLVKTIVTIAPAEDDPKNKKGTRTSYRRDINWSLINLKNDGFIIKIEKNKIYYSSERGRKLTERCVTQIHKKVFAQHIRNVSIKKVKNVEDVDVILSKALKVSKKNNHNPSVFTSETQQEQKVIDIWPSIDFGSQFKILEESGDLVGRQYIIDGGRIDILALSEDNKTFLVVELKKDQVTDSTIGQILRYMSYVREEIADDDQTVRGVIIASKCNKQLMQTINNLPNVDYYKYELTMKISKQS